MEGAKKVAQTLRNHWKKTVFLTGVTTYGTKWYVKRHQDNEMMSGLCREALSLGSSTQSYYHQNYHVTVILNPVASGGTGRKMYEKYCAPLLHLAGFKVSVKLTEAEGEAKELMEIMENTDAVLVAGGDGTLMEAVTGLMRRADRELFRRVPIGIIPLGENNSLAHRLFSPDDKVILMAEATMAVVRQLRKPVSVFEVENLSEEEQYRGKKIYGVSGLEMGAWREAGARRDKYWILGGLKHRMTYVLSYLTGHAEVNWSWPVNVAYSTLTRLEREVVEPASSRLLSLVWAPSSPTTTKRIEVEEVIDWKSCSSSNSSSSSSSSSSSNSSSEISEESSEGWEGSQIEINLEAEDGGGDVLEARLYPRINDNFLAFVQQGIRRVKGEKEEAASIGDLRPEVITADNFHLVPRLPEGAGRKLSIDGEEMELTGPLRINLLKDKLMVFCPQDKASTAAQLDVGGGRGPGQRWTTGLSSLGGSSATAAALAGSAGQQRKNYL